ncbi:MAG: hypothetical protein HMLIMOIP_002668 [Candidatus Nitrosomirales archaeon]|jgi:hypothetical protein
MAGEHEVKRRISDDIILDCNFDLTAFPAIITSKIAKEAFTPGRILLMGKELYKLMEEIADRFDMDVVKRETTKTVQSKS